MFPTVNLRSILWAILVVSLLANFLNWQHDYPPPVPVTGPVAGTANQLGSNAPAISPPTGDVPGASPSIGAAGSAAGSGGLGARVPSATPVASAPPARGQVVSANAAAPAASATVEPAPVVHVVTDLLDLDISLAGGELSRADLLQYPVEKGQDQRVRLLNRDNPASLYVVQSGLAAAAGADAPTHLARFDSAAGLSLTLAPGQEELRLPLTWKNALGVTVTKTYVFHRGRYGIDLEWQVQNAGGAPFAFAPYAQILRENQPVATSYFHPDTYDYKGPAYDDGKKYQKLKLDPSKPPSLDAQVQGGWLAGLQHHFVAAIVPPADAPWHYKLETSGNEYLFSATGASQQVAPGGAAHLTSSLFVGPKLQGQLDATSARLYLVTDYGKLSFLAQPLFWLLEKIDRLIGNWGFTIIITTFLLKLLFYPLSEASMRSMARMKALQPRIKQMQETYKDERDKLGKAMMELYQKEKVNPLAGCLPMLIQFPVFIAFYWVLLGSVEMRQAPFIGWIGDLSSRDPWFILPVLMLGANVLNLRVNPQVGDPTQQKVMMIMQIGMPVLFAFFPAGLVLYWVTNTALSILQQWNINRRLGVKS
jgi:YidC/Oxa1 family membrane protein insertase